VLLDRRLEGARKNQPANPSEVDGLKYLLAFLLASTKSSRVPDCRDQGEFDGNAQVLRCCSLLCDDAESIALELDIVSNRSDSPFS
jgi:hypothetical protein